MGMASKIIKKMGINLPEKYSWLGSAIFGVLGFMFITWLMWLVIVIASAFNEAKADGWFRSAESFLLIERDRLGIFCADGPEGLTSNIGASVDLYKRGVFVWQARAVHHSCSFAKDAPSYDAIGTGFVLRFSR